MDEWPGACRVIRRHTPTDPHARQWETFGEIDPYYAVITADANKAANFDAQARDAFFRSGELHCQQLVELLRRHVEPDLVLGTVVDHGCGVGRIVIPLARLAERVHGIDVSQSMLREAADNVLAAGVENVEFHLASDFSALRGTADLVHSFIVFQHMPRAVGEQALTSLLGLLKPGGLAVIHVPVSRSSLKWKVYFDVVQRVPLGPRLWSFASGRPWTYPVMEMHTYDILRLVEIARAGDSFCRHIEPVDADPTGGQVTHRGCLLVFRRSR